VHSFEDDHVNHMHKDFNLTTLDPEVEHFKFFNPDIKPYKPKLVIFLVQTKGRALLGE
jgi:hypothetical protein